MSDRGYVIRNFAFGPAADPELQMGYASSIKPMFCADPHNPWWKHATWAGMQVTLQVDNSAPPDNWPVVPVDTGAAIMI